jgi:hypothetical protein
LHIENISKTTFFLMEKWVKLHIENTSKTTYFLQWLPHEHPMKSSYEKHVEKKMFVKKKIELKTFYSKRRLFTIDN